MNIFTKLVLSVYFLAITQAQLDELNHTHVQYETPPEPLTWTSASIFIPGIVAFGIAAQMHL